MSKFCIGGEFELNTDTLAQNTCNTPIMDVHGIYTDTGRSAIYLALQAILQQGGTKEAWLPAYCCASVLLPFHELGFVIHFYSMGSDLQTPAGLPPQLTNSTLLYIHYFGKKNNAIVDWLVQHQCEHNCFIIEDCVQAGLNDNVGCYGDFSVRSYRKFLPQPDGALLTYTRPFEYQLEASNEAFISQKTIGKLLRGTQQKEQEFLTLFANSEQIIDKTVIPRQMSWLSSYLFKKTNLDYIKKQRCKNWLNLHELLHTSKLCNSVIRPLYTSLDEGEVPLGYPVFIQNNLRNKLRWYLMKNNIFCPVHWMIDEKYYAGYHELDIEQEISLSILTLPIDQRITDEMLQYMLGTIEDFFTKEIK